MLLGAVMVIGYMILLSCLVVASFASSAMAASAAEPTAAPYPDYIGSDRCAGCHQPQFERWQHSHHAKAMLPATAASVRGDFNNRTVSQGEASAEFERQGDKFYVITQGVKGESGRFQVQYTFGFTPLQQYLVAFPGGRLQTLPWAWDTQQKRWFYVPQQVAAPDDWLYWTNGAMNWNSMCADCHSTRVEKNYDADQDTYATTWSEINVGCEACHGPGAEHQNLIGRGELEKARAAIQSGTKVTALKQVEQCGRCHSRRSQLDDGYEHGKLLLDHYLPETLRPGLYHSDGQIQDEVFVYGSFIQSKMYGLGITCNSCHDPHSGSLKAEGNQLCGSCHEAARYDAPQHHHHPQLSEGAQCVSCHMPGKYYMGVDFRHDHSLRIPRPDLSAVYGTPNACNNCHQDQPAAWAAQQIVDWFGRSRPAHFSDVLAAAADDLGTALPQLITLSQDSAQPAIARATAVFWLAGAAHLPQVQEALIKLLTDQAPLVRFQAVNALETLPVTRRVELLAPLLDDPRRAVRIAAVAVLADVPATNIPESLYEARIRAEREQQEYMAQNADFSGGQGYIAMQHEKRGEWQAARQAYGRALAIDQRNTALRLNLANLLYRLKDYQAAEQAFKKAIEYAPEFGPSYYSLGLLLAELKRYVEAEHYLSLALARMPDNARVRKNLEALRAYLRR